MAMKSTKINELLEKYFEGNTEPAEEIQLREYFANEKIRPEHFRYKAMFEYFSTEQKVELEDTEFIPKLKEAINLSGASKRKSAIGWYKYAGIAASLLIAITLGIYLLNIKSETKINPDLQAVVQTPAPKADISNNEPTVQEDPIINIRESKKANPQVKISKNKVHVKTDDIASLGMIDREQKKAMQVLADAFQLMDDKISDAQDRLNNLDSFKNSIETMNNLFNNQ